MTKVKVKKPAKSAAKKKSTPKKKAPGKPGRKPQVGKTMKLSVAATWNRIFNKQRTAKLDDGAIATFMRKEFPEAKKYTEADVVLMRNRHNNGRLHESIAAPKTRCPQYVNKQAQPLWGSKSAAKKKTVKKKKPAKKSTSKKKSPTKK